MKFLLWRAVEKPMQMFHTAISVSAFVLGLTACGGGGGEDKPGDEQPQSFAITAEAGVGGSISPASQTVTSGSKAVVTLIVDAGYTISDVTGCGGTLEGTTYETGPVTANCTVKASFVAVNGVAPTAKILFPWKYSRTNEPTMVVRGVASGTNIKSIKVNGVDAVIAPQFPQAAFAIRSGKPMATLADTSEDVAWEAEVMLPESEDSEIVVEIENNTGEIIQNADSVEIFKRRIPIVFTIDSEGRQLIGQTNSRQFALYGLDDGQYLTIDLEERNPCSALAYKTDSGQVICADLIDDKLYLSGVKIGTNELAQIYQHDLNLNPEEWLFVHVQELTLSSDDASLFILLKLFSSVEYELNKSVILRYDFSSGLMATIVDGKTQSDIPITTDNFAYTVGGLLVFSQYFGNGDDGLRQVDLAGADSTFVTSKSNLLLSSIDVSSTSNTAYMAGYEGIVKVNLADGVKSEISLESEEELYNISQIRSTGLDEENNRLLIADDGFDYILSVDLDSGERAEFAANGVGDGKRLLTPRAIALDEFNSIAYLLDEGSGGLLVQVDLNTGDRTVVAEFGFDCHHYAREVIFDADVQKLYAVFSEAVYQIDSANGFSVMRLDNHSGGSDCDAQEIEFAGATLDKNNNRLLIAESITDALLELNLTTGAVTALVESSENFDAAVDVSLDAENDVAYVLSQANGDVHAYNLISGETSLVLDSCANQWGNDALDPEQGGVQSMHFDAAHNALWITVSTVIRYDLNTGICAVMDSFGSTNSTLDLAMTEQGQLLGTQFSQIVQIDFESGRQVIISK